MDLKAFYRSVNQLQPSKIIVSVLKENSEQIEAMQKDRLYKDGTYLDGKKIKTYKARRTNYYADRTIADKKRKNKTFSHVTLNDTGQFYKSIKSKVSSSTLFITAKWQKRSGQISDNLDTDNILGLTKENIEFLQNRILIRLLYKLENLK